MITDDVSAITRQGIVAKNHGFIPAPDALAEIVRSAHIFTKFIRETYWIVGQRMPTGFPGRKSVILEGIQTISALESSLNPRRIPFGGKGRKSMAISNWPNPQRLLRTLSWISDLHDSIIELWQLHPVCEGKPLAFVSGGGGGDDGSGIPVKEVDTDWPPKLDEDVVDALETASTQLAEYVAWFEQHDQRTTPIISRHDEESDDSKAIALDGPHPPNVIQFGGKSEELEPIPFRLVEYMWDRDAAEICDVCNYVWGEDADRISDSAINSARTRANKALMELGVGWTLGRKSGHLRKM